MGTMRAAAPLDGEAVLPLELIRTQLGVDGDEKDALIESHRLAALDWVERHTGLSIDRREWVVTLSGFAARLRLPRPAPEVSAITYLDPAGVERSAAGLWRRSADAVVVAPGAAWPAALSADDAVRIEVVAGYADLGVEAPALLTAALMLVMHLFDGGSVNAVPATVTALCESYRQPVIG